MFEVHLFQRGLAQMGHALQYRRQETWLFQLWFMDFCWNWMYDMYHMYNMCNMSIVVSHVWWIGWIGWFIATDFCRNFLILGWWWNWLMTVSWTVDCWLWDGFCGDLLHDGWLLTIVDDGIRQSAGWYSLDCNYTAIAIEHNQQCSHQLDSTISSSRTNHYPGW